MELKLSKTFTGRLKIVQCLLVVAFCSNSVANEFKGNILSKFNPKYKIQNRGPQSFSPDVDYTPKPEARDVWYQYILVEDDAGVLRSIKNDLEKWEQEEEYVKNWDLESTGLYTIVSQERKKNYLGKRILKYVDKRISGEVKKAEEGSTLAAVGKAQKALKPSTKVSVSENIKLKFKARVLQGMAILKIDNPYVDYNTTYSFSDGLRMKMKKEFKSIRSVASVDYNPEDKVYTAQFDKGITNTISARVSSYQDHGTGIFAEESDSTIQLRYSSPFNY